ncbi:MAG: ATP-binding protein [Proteobacteria bacterium]|jgi:anti-sigma regulatory factor (Ser/Thr protein kinase)|nr:ATP-binding protein [Pseudomonadota bacterium]
MTETDRLTLPATLESLERIRAFAREAAVRAGLDPQRSYALQLALDEIATNVVSYGYGPSRTDGRLALRSEVAGGALVVVLEDWAPAFDPRTRELPTEEDLSLPLEERNTGGLGIFLAVKGVDRFDYRRVGDKNETIFEVRIGGQS